MNRFILTLKDISKLMFGRFEYGVGDTPPKGKRFSDLDTAEVARTRILLRILKRFGRKT